jgi:tetraacyldisaccharide 4'-kinase
VVEKFARALHTGGRRVAILSRGYKSVPKPTKRNWLDRLLAQDVDPPRVVSDGKLLFLDPMTAGDEPYMLAHNLKDVIVLVDKDRVKSGKFAIDKWKVDTLLLDDGLQYLHLKHRLDIVLVDRQAPFGNEFLLPRGTLREPPRNLRRASYIFITKNTGQSNDMLIARIRRYNRTAEIIECAHRPLYLQNIYTGERLMLDRLRGAFIGSICGIAAPESFEGALKNLGANVDLAQLHQSLHPARSGADHYHGKGCRPDAAIARSGCESADLFHARRNRDPQRARNLGTVRRPHLQTATDALARTILRLRICHR